MAIIKNGPKAIWLFIPAFLPKISMIPTIAPVKKAKNSHTKSNFGPTKSPPKTANLTSPRPMPRPRVSRWMDRSKEAPKKPANNDWNNKLGIRNKAKRIATKTNESGII